MKNAFNVLINRFEIAEDKYQWAWGYISANSQNEIQRKKEWKTKPRAFTNHKMVSKCITCIIWITEKKT